jgi:RimJ/RimL family protein N-acetyltransferase
MSDISPDERFYGDLIYLQHITIQDCGERYLGWMKDDLVNQYLETRWKTQNLQSIREFVENALSNQSYLFKIIFCGEPEFHIGNIKIGPLNRIHGYADVSYFIGERASWGKGYATQAVKLATKIAFERLNLFKLQAGIYASNIASGRVLEKCGYQIEAVFRKKLIFNAGREDHLVYGIFRDDWINQNRV